jgi:alkylated DNA nucleotide flippase Atl1
MANPTGPDRAAHGSAGRDLAANASTGRDLAADVLDAVDLVPPGRVVTYGDVAAHLACCGPRQVGQVMSRWGGAVAWWRVVRADGGPPPGHEEAALRHYRREGTPLRPAGTRVDLARARFQLPPLAEGPGVREERQGEG